MPETRPLLERVMERVELRPFTLEGFHDRRDRKRRNQRITAGVVGIAVFVAAVWIVTSVGSLDRSETPAGSAETGPAVSNCVVTRCTETGPVQPTPTPYPGPAPETTGYLIDLNTGEMTQLPKSIAGIGYAVSPDGTMVAYISGDNAVFIASLDGTDVQQVTHDQRGAWAPAWSPDGEAISYASGAYTSVDEDVNNIFVLDLATGETSQVTNEKPTTETNLSVGLGLGAIFPQFSPDGASIIYEVHRGDGFSMRIVPVTGGKSALLVGGGKNDVEAKWGTFSPDGSTLAASCLGRLEGICIAHADGTKLRVLVSGPSLVEPNWSPDGTRIAYTDAEQPVGEYKIFVVDVATGETTFVAEGIDSEWLDDHTLIIENFGPP
jgi:Tol biopolymer transport system component